MKLEDMLKFSLGFMLKKPQSLIFFIPLFLLNLISMVTTYFLLGDLIEDPEGFANLIKSTIESGNIMSIFSIPQIQVLLGFSLLSAILTWVLSSYAGICVYKAAELEQGRKKWDARRMLGKFVGILPRYLGLVVLVGILTSIPTILGIGLILLWQLGLLNSVILGILGLLLIILGFILMIYLTIKFSIARVALVIENKGIVESLKRSWFLTGGSFWYVLGYIILFWIVIMVISIIISLPVMVISFVEGLLIPMSPVSSIMFYLINFYTTTAGVVFSYMIYLSLIEREDKSKS